LLKSLCTAPDLGALSLADFRSHWQGPWSDTIRELAQASFIQVDHLETPSMIAIHPLIRSFVKEAPEGLLDEADPVA